LGYRADGREELIALTDGYREAYGVRFSKAVAKITDDVEQLLAFCDHPAEHGVHLRTTNPIAGRPRDGAQPN
jgi:transposase-like protein